MGFGDLRMLGALSRAKGAEGLYHGLLCLLAVLFRVWGVGSGRSSLGGFGFRLFWT